MIEVVWENLRSKFKREQGLRDPAYFPDERILLDLELDRLLSRLTPRRAEAGSSEPLIEPIDPLQ